MIEEPVVDAASSWPIPVQAAPELACGVRLWVTGGRRRVTVIAKATFELVHGGDVRLAPPERLRVGDHQADGLADRSVEGASDLAPYLPRAEVLFRGSACSTVPVTGVAARLAVVSAARALVDKTIHVFGERQWAASGAATEPVPFERMPVTWERTTRGPAGFELNPVGMALAPGAPLPNVVDPTDPTQPAGLGPIATSWLERRRLLRGLDPAIVERAEPELPDTFAWSYFHAAPADQRCGFLEGSEWIVLEGLTPSQPRLETRLGEVRATARVVGLPDTDVIDVALRADTLAIDGDRERCTLVWRGNFELPPGLEPARLCIYVGLDRAAQPVVWPDAASTANERAAREALAPAAPGVDAVPVADPAAIVDSIPLDGTMSSHDRRSPLHADSRERVPTIDLIELGPRLPSAAAQQTVVPESETAIRVAPHWIEPSTTTTGGWSGASPGALSLTGTGGVPSEGVSTVQRPNEVLRALAAQPLARPCPVPEPPRLAPAELDQRMLRTTIRGIGMRSLDAPPPTQPRTAALERVLEQEIATRHMPIPVALLDQARRDDAPAAEPDALARTAVVEPAEPPDDDLAPETHAGSAPSVAGHPRLPTLEIDLAETRAELVRRLAQGASLAGTDLSDLQLDGFDFSGRDLAGARLDRANLRGASLARATLDGASLEGTTLEDAMLDEASLVGANLVGARLARASLRGAALTDANLTTADLRDAALDGAHGERVVLSRARLDRASLRGARLDGADLSEAFLVQSSLEGASLLEVRATELNASLASFARTALEGASFVGAALEGASFERAFARGASFARAALDGADLSNAALDGANFERAGLEGARLTSARAVGARFDHAAMAGADLRGTVLEGASLVGADVRNATTR
jgi:uncharacterized protein YjbI with pentapeptide repeats